MNKLCTLIAGLVLATASITSVAQTPAATPSSTYPNKPLNNHRLKPVG